MHNIYVGGFLLQQVIAMSVLDVCKTLRKDKCILVILVYNAWNPLVIKPLSEYILLKG